MSETTYTTAEVVKASGVSFRQLQWWDEQHVVTPRRSGHSRVFGRPEMVRVLLVAALRQRGISLQRICRTLKAPLLKRIEDGAGERFLLGNNFRWELIESRDELFSRLKAAKELMFLVSIEDVLRPITTKPAANGAAPRGKKK